MEQLKSEQKLADFGPDSILAAEFRTLIFHALEVDVPFVTLLVKDKSVDRLVILIAGKLHERRSR